MPEATGWDRAHNVEVRRLSEDEVALVFSDSADERDSGTLDAAGEPKTFLLASTRGALKLNIGGTIHKINLNVMRPNAQFDAATVVRRQTAEAAVLEI